MQSSSARKLMTDTFADLFKGISELQATEFLQLATHQAPAVNLTNFSNPPIPRTEIPADPCTDKDHGAPSVEDKRNAKCTITKSPQCYKLQERFLLIQSGIQDERDALLEDIASMKQQAARRRTSRCTGPRPSRPWIAARGQVQRREQGRRAQGSQTRHHGPSPGGDVGGEGEGGPGCGSRE